MISPLSFDTSMLAAVLLRAIAENRWAVIVVINQIGKKKV